MMKIWLCAILVLVGAIDALSASELPKHPLTFKHWKRVQIHNSQSDVVSKSSVIQKIYKKLNDQHLPKDVHDDLARSLKGHEKEQKTNLERLQFSKELTFADYFDVYLKQFSGNKEALQFIAQRLSKTSVAYLLEKSMDEEVAKPEQAEAAVKISENTSEDVEQSPK